MNIIRAILILLVIVLLIAYYQYESDPKQFEKYILLFKQAIQTLKQTALENNPVFYCPAPDEVVKNSSNVGAWNSSQQSWSINLAGWPFNEKNVGFMQALINIKTNDLVCYYRWKNPKDPGTYLWLTVKWMPNTATAIPKAVGNHWRVAGDDLICDSGYKACGFVITH